MNNYEFSSEDNAVISDLARWMLIVGGIAVLSGVVFVILGIVNMFGTAFSFASILETLRGAVVLCFGLAFVLPTDNLRRIVKNQGNDINELMTALTEIKTYLTWTLGLIVVMIPLILFEALF